MSPSHPRHIFLMIELCPYLARRLRSLGSAALNMCMVALGGADVSFEFGIHAWDIAAGDLIVREAGGVSIDPAGKEHNITHNITHNIMRRDQTKR